MPARAENRREGRRNHSLFPIFLSALIVLPNNPFVASAAAQILGAASENASASPSNGSAGAAIQASGLSAPAPLALTAQSFAASLTDPRTAFAPPAALMAASASLPALAAAAPHAALPSAEAAPAQRETLPDAQHRNVPRNGLSRLRNVFSRANKKEAPEPTLDEAFDGALPADQIKAYVIQPGKAPVATNLAGLKSALSDPGLVAELNKHGHLTYVVGDKNPGRSLSRADGETIVKTLGELGVSFGGGRTRIETLLVDWEKKAGPSEAPSSTFSKSTLVRAGVAAGVVALGIGFFGAGHWYQAGLAAYLLSNADRIVRETIYCLRILKTSFKDSKKPLPSEIVGALATKTPAFTMNLVANLTVYAPALGLIVLGVLWPSMAHNIHPGATHWLAFSLATLWSLALETFHGGWVRTWDTFQNRIGKQRGPAYQSVFGFVYTQLTGGVFRTIAFLTLANIFPMWDIRYLGAISWMTIIGTVCGVAGFRGLNELYDKGRITAKRRSNIQQFRDLCWLAIGPFFNSGNMFMTLILFTLQQSVDLAIYFVNRRTPTRPILVFTDGSVAASKELPLSYPVDAKNIPPSPLKYATDALKGFVLLKPFLALYRAIKKRVRR
ncbi:MAG: hypothetical protein ACHQ2Z_00130 [Elusimicrobiota bacterium]